MPTLRTWMPALLFALLPTLAVAGTKGASATRARGIPVHVHWGGALWGATIETSPAPNMYRIHYTGWDKSWDETVTCDRVFAPSGSGELYVEWGNRYWAASVVRSDRDGALIHYEGWGDEWDEVVGVSRTAYLVPLC